MNSINRFLRKYVHITGATIILLLGLIITAALFINQRNTINNIVDVRFTEEVRSTTDAIEQRMVAYSEVVAGVRDLFLINPNLSHDQFEFIVSNHNVIKNYPEIQNIAFVRPVYDHELSDYTEKIRKYAKHHFGDYDNPIHNLTPDAKEHFINEYVWPNDNNLKVWGLDISSQPSNLQSLLWAKQTGEAVVTKPFDLIQFKENRHGILLRYPIYKNSVTPDAQFIGAVAASIRIKDMLERVRALGFINNVNLNIHDIGSTFDVATKEPAVLFGTFHNSDSSLTNSNLSAHRDLIVHNRIWRLEFEPTANLLSTTEAAWSWLILNVGVLISLILFGMYLAIYKQRLSAVSALKHTHRKLAYSERRLGRVLDNLPIGVCLVEDDIITYRNKRYVDITGYNEQNLPDIPTWWVKTYPKEYQREIAIKNWDGLCKLAPNRNGIMPPQEYKITAANGSLLSVEIGGTMLDKDYLLTIEDITERKLAEEEINYLAYYDSLTQLPNRRYLIDSLQQILLKSQESGLFGAIILIDLDHFKNINETMGHDIGDFLLRQVAQRLRSNLHKDQLVARLGDDEFVIVYEDLIGNYQHVIETTEKIAEDILSIVRKPYILGSKPYYGSVSMGVTLFQGDKESVNEILKQVDMAMYQAKDKGRNTMQFYNPKMQKKVGQRVLMEQEMRAGIESNQFELYYQPQVNNGVITGVEALIRWNHPEKGYISPGDFIPFAEDTGAILQLGQWVLQTACKQIQQWNKIDGLDTLSMSINVSPRQFYQSSFVNQVVTAIDLADANPKNITLELTERLLLQDIDDTIRKMTILKMSGVGFSLDDFGTGYSSLSYLKRLPLDELKIDQSFVRDVLIDTNDAAIAKTIVALGTSLGLNVIAEGVETEKQRQFLYENKCYRWQGFLLSKPLPADKFIDLVTQYNSKKA